jgi:hypothetical protein
VSSDSYSKLLLDPRWQKRRLQIFDRDGWQCTACGNKDKTLNVHHLEYSGKPWEAPDDCLETLCEDCHEWRTWLAEKFYSGKVKTRILYGIFWGLELAFCYDEEFVNKPEPGLHWPDFVKRILDRERESRLARIAERDKEQSREAEKMAEVAGGLAGGGLSDGQMGRTEGAKESPIKKG